MRTTKKAIRTVDTASPTFRIVFIVLLFPLCTLWRQAMPFQLSSMPCDLNTDNGFEALSPPCVVRLPILLALSYFAHSPLTTAQNGSYPMTCIKGHLCVPHGVRQLCWVASSGTFARLGQQDLGMLKEAAAEASNSSLPEFCSPPPALQSISTVSRCVLSGSREEHPYALQLTFSMAALYSCRSWSYRLLLEPSGTDTRANVFCLGMETAILACSRKASARITCGACSCRSSTSFIQSPPT